MKFKFFTYPVVELPRMLFEGRIETTTDHHTPVGLDTAAEQRFFAKYCAFRRLHLDKLDATLDQRRIF
jgi:hypothetical protein